MRKLCWMIIFTAIMLQGCAHGTIENRIDEKLAKETAIQAPSDLIKEENQLIESTPGLTGEQRNQLSDLRRSVRAQIHEIHEQSLRLRSLLVKDMLSKNYEDDEVDAIKSRLKDLANRKLAITFGAIEQTNRILGHKAPQNLWRVEQFVHQFEERHNG